MIKYSNGTVFNCDVDAIVNTVNCVGVMGAGIALEFGLRYPNMYDQYKQDCKNKLYDPGSIKYYKEKDITIVNFATKWHFKYPSQEAWIKTGLKNFINSYKQQNIKSIAFPKLGTLNGGLEWNRIQYLMEMYLGQLDDIDITICLDTNDFAEGKELQMLNTLKENSTDIINNLSKVNSKQKEILLENIPNITRFWQLSKLEGIGITTYSKLFNACYENNNNPCLVQISLFD